jgi:SAM-dependent methyltransferase
VKLEYGKEYRNLYEHHWWWRSREEAVVHLLRRSLPGNQRNILDIGCGDALFFDRLAEFGEVEGLETDNRLINPANPHLSKIYVQPFDENFRPGKCYGCILMLDVLEHLDCPKQALARVHELLEKGGIFLLTVPAFQSLWTNHDVINHHRIRYRKKTLLPPLREAGFSISFTRYWYHWTVVGKLATRVVERLTSTQPSLPRVPAAWLNRFFFNISRLEQRALSPLSLPFGTTLVVACTKT